ncbi:MAG: hypothetical protein FWE72_03490 [Spirochaetaceae bacterium]|nr:hypothetical protein [Spirochaetaceae bacterium]
MLRYINNIISQPDHKVIFSRLGYKQKQTELDEATKKKIMSWIDETASLVKLRGVILECDFEIVDEGKFLIYPVKGVDPDFHRDDVVGNQDDVVGNQDDVVGNQDDVVGNQDDVKGNRDDVGEHRINRAEKIEIASNSFCKFILEAKKILLMGITCGKEIMDLIEKEQKENMTKAVVLDAAAGEIADSGLDYIVSFYNKELIRKSEKLFSKRFSPGYGDLSLETQKVFYDLLEMNKIGVDMTESFMLIPQKSIIALTGIT